MKPRPYGSLASGESVEAYTLTNASGASAEVLTYGGIVTSLRVPDRRHQISDVVLGFGSLGDYVGSRAYFGAITGRVTGRVREAQITVGGRTYDLAPNDGRNHLHGGVRGLDRRVWSALPRESEGGASSLLLAYESPDGEEGYPGSVQIEVTYTLTASDEFVVETEVSSDRPTPVSLANHSYFNLAGEGSGDVLGHELQILAEAFIPADDAMILSGRPESVAGRPADFRTARRLGEALPDVFKGHGDFYVLDRGRARTPGRPPLAARLSEATSGRVLEVYTDESCMQFYSGVSLESLSAGKSGVHYRPHSGLCLECHGYPDPSGSAGFSNIMVAPGRPQRRRTVYAFSAR